MPDKLPFDPAKGSYDRAKYGLGKFYIGGEDDVPVEEMPRMPKERKVEKHVVSKD